MTCRQFDQAKYEHDLTEYIRDALELPDRGLDVLVRHVPSQSIHYDDYGELIFVTDLEIVIAGRGEHFSVRLDNWPLERSLEEDLGRYFIHALRLLREAFVDVREHYFRALSDEGTYQDI